MVTKAWDELAGLAAGLGALEAFAPADLGDLPPPVARYLDTAIAPGTSLAPGVVLAMRGSIKIGRWFPFRARQLLVPRLGTVWEARVAGVISGSDRFVAGRGGMDWKLLGLVRMVHAHGEDVSRSAAERAAAESIWAPTALARRGEVTWSAPDDEHVTVELTTDGHPVAVEHELDEAGRIRRSHLERWGDPDRSGTFASHPFGVEVTGHRSFGGVTIPHRGRAGWHFGTDRWEAGVFFRYEITAYELLT